MPKIQHHLKEAWTQIDSTQSLHLYEITPEGNLETTSGCKRVWLQFLHLLCCLFTNTEKSAREYLLNKTIELLKKEQLDGEKLSLLNRICDATISLTERITNLKQLLQEISLSSAQPLIRFFTTAPSPGVIRNFGPDRSPFLPPPPPLPALPPDMPFLPGTREFTQQQEGIALIESWRKELADIGQSSDNCKAKRKKLEALKKKVNARSSHPYPTFPFHRVQILNEIQREIMKANWDNPEVEMTITVT